MPAYDPDTPAVEPGAEFGRLTVVRLAAEQRNTPARERAGKPIPPSLMRWVCRCRCGRESPVLACALRQGSAAQCRHCANETARAAGNDLPQTRAARRRLTQRVWPRTCAACGGEFLAATRGRYCGPACRPCGQETPLERRSRGE